MHRRLLHQILLTLTLLPAAASARLGETASQCADRYGMPKTDQVTKIEEKTFPLLQGAIIHTYVYQGWKIRAAFLTLDGPAVRIEYHKVPAAGVDIQIKDFEVEAILKGECPDGCSWTRNRQPSLMDLAFPNRWERSDGALAGANVVMLRLDLPAAKQHEAQLKQQRDQNARANVPKF